MPEFQLDTSGRVQGVPPCRGFAVHPVIEVRYHGSIAFADLDAFTQGYIEALFFTSEESLCEESNGARHMPDVAFNLSTMESHFVGGDSFGFSDLAPCALASIIADCEAFQRDNATTLSEAYQRDYDATQAGRDFWFTRCGHGVGFWDRDALEPDSEAYGAAVQAVVDARGDNDAWGRAVDKRNALKAESIGERLSKAARAAGNRDAYLGDDGKVYVS